MISFAVALVLAAVGPAAHPPADGTYNYTGARAGVIFGRTSVVVTHSDNSVGITENGAGSVEGTSGTAQATLNLSAADLSPTAYTASLNSTGVSAKSTLAFAGPTAALTGMTGNQSFNLLAGTTHFAVVDGALLDGYVALPAQLAAWNNAPATLIIPVYAQASKLAPNSSAAAVRPIAVPTADLSLTFDQPVPVTEWYDPVTLIPDEIDVPSLKLVISRVR